MFNPFSRDIRELFVSTNIPKDNKINASLEVPEQTAETIEVYLDNKEEEEEGEYDDDSDYEEEDEEDEEDRDEEEEEDRDEEIILSDEDDMDSHISNTNNLDIEEINSDDSDNELYYELSRRMDISPRLSRKRKIINSPIMFRPGSSIIYEPN